MHVLVARAFMQYLRALWHLSACAEARAGEGLSNEQRGHLALFRESAQRSAQFARFPAQ